MSEIKDPEDILIRRLLLGGSIFAVLGFLATVFLVAVMISYNFNFLRWME